MIALVTVAPLVDNVTAILLFFSTMSLACPVRAAWKRAVVSAANLLLGSLLAVEGSRLGILLSLLSLGLCDGVLHKLCTLLLFRRLRVPAVADKHKRDEHEADDVVLIHKSFLSGVGPNHV